MTSDAEKRHTVFWAPKTCFIWFLRCILLLIHKRATLVPRRLGIISPPKQIKLKLNPTKPKQHLNKTKFGQYPSINQCHSVKCRFVRHIYIRVNIIRYETRWLKNDGNKSLGVLCFWIDGRQGKKWDTYSFSFVYWVTVNNAHWFE